MKPFWLLEQVVTTFWTLKQVLTAYSFDSSSDTVRPSSDTESKTMLKKKDLGPELGPLEYSSIQGPSFLLFVDEIVGNLEWFSKHKNELIIVTRMKVTRRPKAVFFLLSN